MDKEKESIKKANERWVNSKPRVRSQKEISRINEAMSTQHLKRDKWLGRNYKAVRG